MHTISWQSVGPSLDECIKCNICTSYCPVSRGDGSLPGPKYVGPQAQRFRENGPAAYAGSFGGLLLRLSRLQRGLSHRREDRRDQRPRRGRRWWPKTGIPLRNRLLGRNELLGKIGNYRPAPGQLWPAQSRQPLSGRKGDGHRPRSAPAPLEHDRQLWRVDEAYRGDERLQVATRRSSISRLRHHVLRALHRQGRRGRAGAQRLRGDRAAAELLRSAHAQQRRI